MLDSLSLWLHETPLGETLLTMLISMLPVVELRGGLPAGVAMGLPIPVAFAASLVGNMIPVPFIIYLSARCSNGCASIFQSLRASSHTSKRAPRRKAPTCSATRRGGF